MTVGVGAVTVTVVVPGWQPLIVDLGEDAAVEARDLKLVVEVVEVLRLLVGANELVDVLEILDSEEAVEVLENFGIEELGKGVRLVLDVELEVRRLDLQCKIRTQSE